MNKFYLEKAKAGAPIVTRDGRPARLLGEVKHPNYPIVVAVRDKDGTEEVFLYTDDGRNYTQKESKEDLFMVPIIHKKYANLYFDAKKGEYRLGDIHDAEVENKFLRMMDCDYIKTIEIEWEE